MSRRTQRNVGVIGLGIIGQRIADSLRRRGFHVFVWNRTPRPYPNFVGSPAELAELCDFIQIFVSNDEALLQMVQQMKQSLKAHHIVMAHSTVAPATMREAAEIVQRRGAQLLDAPFTGSKDAAGKGELVYYVAGDDAAYRRARPVLEASSKEIVEIGEIGQATTIKVATNMITAATVQVASEAMALVHEAGIPLEKFTSAMRSNGSNSGTLTMKLPKMLEGDFAPHFSVKHMLKDVQIALSLARSRGLDLEVTEVARAALRAEMEQGHGDDDYSAVIRRFFPEPVSSVQAAPEAETSELPLAEAPHETPESVRLNGAEEAKPVSAEREEISEPAATEERIEPEDRAKDESVAIEPERDEIGAREMEEPERAEREEVADANERAEAPAEAVAPEQRVASADAPEPAERRGFLSRIFGRGADY